MTNPFLNQGNDDNSLPLRNSNAEKSVKESLKEIKTEFEFNQNATTMNNLIKREFSIINGFPNFETEYDSYQLYTNFLIELKEIEKKGHILWLGNSIQNLNNIKLVNMLNQYWNTITKIKNPTADDIYRYTYKSHNSNIKNPQVKQTLDLALVEILRDYMTTETNLNTIKNYYSKIILWIEDYVPLLLNNENNFIKNIVIEGVVKRDMFEFLLLLQSIGVTTLYINSNKNEVKTRNNKVMHQLHSKLILFDEVEPQSLNLDNMTKRMMDFETESKKTVKTVARQVSEEIQDVLHSDGNGIIKPWQFENHDVHVARLVTTYDEIIQLWKEPSYLRSGFVVENGCVFIPSIFAKINGTHEDIERYWLDYDTLVSEPNTILLKEFPFINQPNNAPRPIPMNDTGFDYDKIVNSPNYPYKHLRKSIQKLLIDRMNEIIENKYIISDLRKNDYAYMILHTLYNLDEKFIFALQKFDYGQEIPKVVLYMNDTTMLNFMESTTIVLLHLIGFDIVVMCPTGYLTMENTISDLLYEKHYKDDFIDNLEVPLITSNQSNNRDSSKNDKNGYKFGSLIRRFLNE